MSGSGQGRSETTPRRSLLKLGLRVFISRAPLVLLLAASVSAQSGGRPDRTGFELATSFLDALAYASAGKEKLDQTHKDKDPLAVALAEMTSLRIAKQRFGDGRALFINETKSKRQAVALVGEAMTTVFEALEASCERAVALQEALLKVNTRDDAVKLVSETSKLQADVDEVWRLLPQGALALSFALLDEKRQTDGKLQHLRLASAERATLVSRIKREYPNASKEGGGHAIDVSASLLLKFLTGDHKSADQK
jgi:hypothetical protein